MLKLSISYADGWKAIGTLIYSAPQALEKAQAADRIVRQRVLQLWACRSMPCTPSILGVNACHGPVAPPVADPPEVQLAHRRARPGPKRGRPLHARVDPSGLERPARPAPASAKAARRSAKWSPTGRR